MKKTVLASSSPRRIEMMKNNGFDPIVIPSGIDEKMPFAMHPASYVMYLSLKKALDVKARCADDPSLPADTLILAGDTVVTHNGIIIEKPKDRDDAFSMLSSLRSDKNTVISGVCIAALDGSLLTCFCDKADVYFGYYSDEELAAYVDTPEPYDKAGGYAVQGTFSKYVERIEGDIDTVIGFPWHKIRPYLE